MWKRQREKIGIFPMNRILSDRREFVVYNETQH